MNNFRLLNFGLFILFVCQVLQVNATPRRRFNNDEYTPNEPGDLKNLRKLIKPKGKEFDKFVWFDELDDKKLTSDDDAVKDETVDVDDDDDEYNPSEGIDKPINDGDDEEDDTKFQTNPFRKIKRNKKGQPEVEDESADVPKVGFTDPTIIAKDYSVGNKRRSGSPRTFTPILMPNFKWEKEEVRARKY